MIFPEDVKGLIDAKVRFTQECCGKRTVLTGTAKGLSGSGLVLVSMPEGDDTVAVNMKHIYRMDEDVPPRESEREYRIARYMGRIKDLDSLVDFSLTFPLTMDSEAREAYTRRACELAGYKVK